MKEITGYRDPDFLGRKYITLCSGGIKPEGMPTKIYNDASDAWSDFEDELKEFLSKYDKKNCTLIWRMKPVLKESEEGCYVIARLVVYLDDIFKILKEKGYFFAKNGQPRFNNGHCLTANINELSKETWEELLNEGNRS